MSSTISLAVILELNRLNVVDFSLFGAEEVCYISLELGDVPG